MLHYKSSTVFDSTEFADYFHPSPLLKADSFLELPSWKAYSGFAVVYFGEGDPPLDFSVWNSHKTSIIFQTRLRWKRVGSTRVNEREGLLFVTADPFEVGFEFIKTVEDHIGRPLILLHNTSGEKEMVLLRVTSKSLPSDGDPILPNFYKAMLAESLDDEPKESLTFDYREVAMRALRGFLPPSYILFDYQKSFGWSRKNYITAREATHLLILLPLKTDTKIDSLRIEIDECLWQDCPTRASVDLLLAEAISNHLVFKLPPLELKRVYEIKVTMYFRVSDK